jgi:hypothetical protein
MAEFSRHSTRASLFSDQQIHEVASRGSGEIASWVEVTARERGISIRRLPNQKFVKAVSRLSDGVVDLDPVEELRCAGAPA